MAITFNNINLDALNIDPTVDKVGAQLDEILTQLMPGMELTTLGFMGLKQCYGAPVKTPNGIFPTTYHVPDGSTQFQKMSNQTYIVEYPIATMFLTGVVGDDLIKLTVDSLKWVLPYLYACECNTRLGGRVQGLEVKSCEWGETKIAKVPYFGIIFHLLVRTYRGVPHDPILRT